MNPPGSGPVALLGCQCPVNLPFGGLNARSTVGSLPDRLRPSEIQDRPFQAPAGPRTALCCLPRCSIYFERFRLTAVARVVFGAGLAQVSRRYARAAAGAACSQ
jgi:hypothetical protein